MTSLKKSFSLQNLRVTDENMQQLKSSSSSSDSSSIDGSDPSQLYATSAADMSFG